MTSRPRTPVAHPWALLFAAVCLVAVNMRMTITGLGPILDQIAADHGVSAAALGALASLPLVVWAVVSPLTHWISERLGTTNTIGWALGLLVIGTVWRSFPGSPANLWVGTVLVGIALAVANVLMPAIVKRDFGLRVPLVMGIYTALLGGMGSVGSGIVVPISSLQFDGEPLGWRIALLATGVLVPAALVVWMLAASRSRRTTKEAAAHEVTAANASTTDPALSDQMPTGAARTAAWPPRPQPGIGGRIWRDPLAWLLATYMGTQSAVFFILATWLAPLETSLGRSPVLAGFDVMLLQIAGIVGSALVPPLFHSRARRWLPALVPAVSIASALGMLLAPDAMLLWVVASGLMTGASLSVALTLIATRARDHVTASALSGMVQSIGYLLAAVGPILFGWVYERSGGWTLPLVALTCVALVQLVVGLKVGAERYVLEPRPGR